MDVHFLRYPFHFVILINIRIFIASVHYDAENECAVIGVMQLKNLHGNVTFERGLRLYLEWGCKS